MKALSQSKVLILGGRTGLLGRSLTSALERLGADASPLGRDEVDVTDESAVADLLDRERPDILLNAVAYTQVDQAEDERKSADELNRATPARLARLCAPRGVFLVHYSTDFVFSGKGDIPYTEKDLPQPVSVYGETKLAGERAVLELLPEASLVIRTAWLFGPEKGNFVHKIIDLGNDREELTVVHDQTGSPTYTPDLALHTCGLLNAGAKGLYHVVNAGRSTWCELAAEALRLMGSPCKVTPITTDQFPFKAMRPAYSVLDTSKFQKATGERPRPWEQALRDYVFEHLLQA